MQQIAVPHRSSGLFPAKEECIHYPMGTEWAGTVNSYHSEWSFATKTIFSFSDNVTLTSLFSLSLAVGNETQGQASPLHWEKQPKMIERCQSHNYTLRSISGWWWSARGWLPITSLFSSFHGFISFSATLTLYRVHSVTHGLCAAVKLVLDTGVWQMIAIKRPT